MAQDALHKSSTPTIRRLGGEILVVQRREVLTRRRMLSQQDQPLKGISSANAPYNAPVIGDQPHHNP